MKTKKKLRIRKEIWLILGIISLLVMLFSIYKIIMWHSDNKKTQGEIKSIEKVVKPVELPSDNATLVNEDEDKDSDYWNYIKLPLMDVSFDDLISKNNDTVAFLKVNGTNINYPVVQTKDNNYYLSHSFNKKKNDAGWVFMDYRNNTDNLDQNTIIYAHGRWDSTMFGSLKNVFKNDWYKNTDNYVVYLVTPNYSSLWQVFSVYSIPTETYYLTTSFGTDKEHEEFIKTIKERSVYEFNANVNTSDKILTLSTCLNNSDKVVLHAKLIKTMNK